MNDRRFTKTLGGLHPFTRREYVPPHEPAPARALDVGDHEDSVVLRGQRAARVVERAYRAEERVYYARPKTRRPYYVRGFFAQVWASIAGNP